MLAIVRAMQEGDVEPTRVVQNALDVLAQVIVAIVAIDEDWTSAALFDFVRRAYPYHELTRGAFDEVLSMLSGSIRRTSLPSWMRAVVGSHQRHAHASRAARMVR
jgi:ATP-dependent Lhr-like helicase